MSPYKYELNTKNMMSKSRRMREEDTHSSLLRSVTARLLPKYEPTCSPGMVSVASIILSILVPSVTEPLALSRGDPVTTV